MKYCSKCGNQCADTANFCPKCGTDFSETQTIPQPQGVQQFQQGYSPPQYGVDQNSGMYPAYPQQAVHKAATGKDYTKMGGWLLLFVILNIIIIVSNLGTAINEIRTSAEALGWFSSGSDIWNAVVINIVGQIITIAAVIFQILFIVQIFGRKHLFLRLDQISRIILFVSTIFTFIVVGMIGMENYGSDTVSQITTSLISVCLGFFLMPLYYCKSIRVRTYMGSDEYMEKAIFAYKNQPPLIR